MDAPDKYVMADDTARGACRHFSRNRSLMSRATDADVAVVGH